MQAAIEGVDNYQEVDNFLASLKSPRTKEIYALHRKLFLRYTGRKSINEVKSAAEATQEIVQYIRKLKDDDGSSYSHRHIALAAIKHDYVMHRDDLVINWKKISKFLGENESKNEIRGYTHEEISFCR